MNPALTQEYLEALACPSCQSYKLLLTKEKIIICQSCLNGYKLIGDIPDFRLENAISFKKKISNYKQGINAVLTVLMGDNKNQSVDIKPGHCVVVGRRVHKEDPDLTYVGKAQPVSYTNLDAEDQQLIERYLSKDKKQAPQNKADYLFDTHKKVLGQFERDPDFLLDDLSVSRSHAILYQDDEGIFLLDLISKNGSYINGYEIESQKLKNNDVVSLGNVSLRVNYY